MDFNSLFRRFFYQNSDSMGDIFHEPDDMRHERRNTAEYDNFERLDPHTYMFQKMEDMFNEMFMSSFRILGFPNLNENLPSEVHVQSPRSIMLRDSEENPCGSFSCKKEFEKDLSSYEEKGGPTEKAHSFSYSKFSSIKTVHLPDGTIEEHRTVIDNNGDKTTTIRRTVDGTSHEVITKSNKQGIKETEENFMNMDENELNNFEQKWNLLQSGDYIEPSVPSISVPTSSPSYWYILKKFFGSPQKDEVKWC